MAFSTFRDFFHRVQGHPCRRKRETHRGFHIQSSELFSALLAEVAVATRPC
jgi:hypothetical protein